MAGKGGALGAMFGAGEVAGFMGLPEARLDALDGAQVVVLGAPGCTPYPTVGFYCAGGPAAIRAGAAAYAANLAHMNFDLGAPVLPYGAKALDAGDLAMDAADAPGNRDRLRAAVAQVLAAGAVPVLIGGDDSLPIPMLEALAGHGPLTILQIDAHIDWRDEVAGERWGLSSTMRRASEMGHVRQIIQVGSRGIGSARPGDHQAALDAGVTFVPAREVAESGIARALSLIPEGAKVVICLDVDALDPSVMPAVIGRTAGGLSYWQVFELIAGVAKKARIVAFDMVEFMPERDVDGQGALVAAQLLAGTIGILARQEMGK
ncbi:arginase family protein [Tabrizicola oligotrophica]|uniref:Arginase n=1 Tax=Tabrizicola oligotrophica TaxID=2710650 RepID=A0A6M0QMY2_9RHOB|nr:arginase family protein [Tabrizicola oligotrophica]NEY88810.1 arginase [Tabrizicola oligotrophica]